MHGLKTRDLVHDLKERLHRVPEAPDPYDEVVAALAAMNPSKQFGPATVRVYVAALRPVPLNELRDAVWEMVKTKVFPPTVAEVLALVAARRLNLPEPFAAWEQVAQAASNGAMRQLPEAVLRAANAIGGSWAIRNTDNTVALRGQFLKAYDEFKTEAQTREVLALSPPPGRAAIEGAKT